MGIALATAISSWANVLILYILLKKKWKLSPDMRLNTNFIKRRDFTFNEILAYQPIEEPNLFSDLGDNAFIPSPIKEYSLVHYLKIHETIK